MQLPSVAQVLQFESLAAADPVVVAGATGLTRPVRWVHVSELADIAGHLRGQEMILTTGIALPEDDAGLRGYIAALAKVDVAAIIVGLGPHFDRSLPAAMMDAADEHSIPLVVLRRHTAFVTITEDVHARLVDAQVEQLQQSVQIHEMMRTMVMDGSAAADLLHEVARVAGRPVVLEDLRHELLEVAEGPRPRGDVITEWAEHTERHRAARRTDYDPRTGWLTSTVGIKGDDWGRLIIMSAADTSLPRGLDQDPLSSVRSTLVMLIERAATTVALGRLVARDRGALGAKTQRELLEGLIAGGRAADEASETAEAIGFPVGSGTLIALGARIHDPGALSAREQHDLLHGFAAGLRTVCVRLSLPIMLAQLGHDALVALVCRTDGVEAEQIERGVSGIGLAHLVVGLASPWPGAPAAGDILREARETAEIAALLGVEARAVHRADLGLDGLLLSLGSDPRLKRFGDDTLAALRGAGGRDGELVDALRSFLFAGRNKSLAAKRSFVSRQWLYEQLDRVERQLGISLDDEETCLRLQVAILATDLRARRAEADQLRRRRAQPPMQGEE